MTAMTIRLNVNGRPRDLMVEPHERLVDVLRDRLGLTGATVGCGEGECGACTVVVNGAAVLSCLMLAVQADGADIITIEGLGDAGPDGGLHPLQKAFINEAAIQCGYCTPGMILTAKALLDRDPDPSPDAVRRALAGNLCRCTGYDKPVQAILAAAAEMRGATAAATRGATVPEAAGSTGNPDRGANQGGETR